MGADLFHVDGRTNEQTDRQNERQRDKTRLLADFRSCANVPNQGS